MDWQRWAGACSRPLERGCGWVKGDAELLAGGLGCYGPRYSPALGRGVWTQNKNPCPSPYSVGNKDSGSGPVSIGLINGIKNITTLLWEQDSIRYHAILSSDYQ